MQHSQLEALRSVGYLNLMGQYGGEVGSGFGFLRAQRETALSAAAAARSLDWSRTPLGAASRWPQSLHSLLAMVFSSPQPMLLWWGPELVQLYNDASLRSFFEGKHPRAMGQRAAESWPELWPHFEPLVRDVMDRGLAGTKEEQWIARQKNGRVQQACFSFSFSPVFDERARVAGVLVIGQDTTEQVSARKQLKSAHEEVERARQRAMNFLAETPASVCTLGGPKHVLETANPVYERVVGVGRMLIGKPLAEALPEFAEQGFVALLDHVYQTGQPLTGAETLVRFDRHGHGTLEDGFFTYACSPRRNARGEVDGIHLFSIDVTDHVRARLASEHSSAGSRALAEALPQHVWTALPDGTLEYVNQRVVTYFGVPAEQILGAGWYAFVHPDDLAGCVERWTRAMQTGGNYEAQFRLRRFDGAYRWYLGRALPMRGEDGALVRWFGTTTDIHEHERIRRELARRAETEQYLLGIVSHDLRNPLNVVVMGASMLAERDDLDEKTTRTVGRILKAAQRSARMISDLLDFTQSRLGAGIQLHPSELDLNELANDVLEEQRSTHPDRVLVLETLGDGRGLWDPDRISQALGNLLSNALHYGLATKPVTVTIQGGSDRVLAKVHNWGEPIPAHLLSSMFKPMQRGTDQQDRSGRSIGLGLFIVQQIAERHGGTVEVSSTAHEGTTFTLSLPRRHAPASA